MIVHVLRKPLIGTVAANALQHGCGALNIDQCRVGFSAGRWPANLVHDGDANAVFPVLHGAGFAKGSSQYDTTKWNLVAYAFGGGGSRIGDSGSVARFFQQVAIK